MTSLICGLENIPKYIPWEGSSKYWNENLISSSLGNRRLVEPGLKNSNVNSTLTESDIWNYRQDFEYWEGGVLIQDGVRKISRGAGHIKKLSVIIVVPVINLQPASVVQLLRTSSIMRLVMSSSPDWSEILFNSHHVWLLLSDHRGKAKWFGAHFYQESRFSSAVKISTKHFTW